MLKLCGVPKNTRCIFVSMMRIVGICICMWALVPVLQAQQMSSQQYIETYRDAAMDNMRYKKVPASITLAQGLLESGAGNSDLALLANNHFGIKCHDWKGETYYKDDDAPNECFRKYPSVQDSYADHADFLRNRSRYARCFQLEITDYKGWARELKAAGYATLPTYAEKLIQTIEKYRLMEYDLMVVGAPVPQPETPLAEKPELLAETGNKPMPAPEDKPANLRPQPEKPAKKPTQVASDDPTKPNRLQIGEKGMATPEGVVLINGLNAVYARQGDTRESIAARYGLAEWQVRRYNDMRDDQEPHAGDIIFLEPKLDICQQTAEHTVESGENLWQIAQKYGIRLQALKALNSLGSGTPAPGTPVRLK